MGETAMGRLDAERLVPGLNDRIRPVLSAIARMAPEEGHGLILTPR
jgi:hypothetical protein